MLASLALLIAAFVAGGYGTIVGAGGGFILVPILLFTRTDLSPATITTLSLGAVLCNSISGIVVYARQRRIDYKTGALFAAATVPTAAIGAVVVNHVPKQPFQIMFGLLLVLVAIFIFIRPGIERKPIEGGRHWLRSLTDSKGTAYTWSYNPIVGAVISFLVGFLAALLGVGGGIMLVPVMVTLLSFPAPIATATSTFILLFTSLSATSVHVLNQDFRGIEQVTILAGLGMIAGAQVGGRLSQRLSGPLIVRMLAIGLVFAGARLILAGLGR